MTIKHLIKQRDEARAHAQRAQEPLSLQAVREDERLACWKIADRERTALKNADPTKAAWLVAFDIANAIKMRGTALTSTPSEPAQRQPMRNDIAQMISDGWKSGKSSIDVAGEILQEFDAAITLDNGGGK